MAGRGRGRGRGTMSFSVETLGFGRGESLPTSSIEPPPLYPPLEFKPVPLATGEEQDYLLALKVELRRTMRESPYYIKPLDVKRDIERYSDKYQLSNHNNGQWNIDYSRFPSELRVKLKKKSSAAVKPNVKKARKVNPEEIAKTLEALEKKEALDGDMEVGEAEEGEVKPVTGAEGEEEEEAGAEEAEEMDEDDLEDETDYNQTYFDNGDNYGQDEDDDLDDGATF